MSSLTHLGQYWSSRHREVRLLGVSDVGGPDGNGGGARGVAYDLDPFLALTGTRRRFRNDAAAAQEKDWSRARWTYSALPFPMVELVELAEATSCSVSEVAGEAFEAARSAGQPLELEELERTPSATVDHLVAPIIPRRAQGFGVTYLNSALEREAEGSRSDYPYVYRSVKENAERPELFFKATAGEHIVGPRGVMGLRRDLTNSSDMGRTATPRVPVSAGIEPELAAVVYSTGEIWGYTLANDVSGNRLENETLLYLTQAKHFTGALVLGPLIWLSNEQSNPCEAIRTRILGSDGTVLFEHETNSERINSPLSQLIEWAKSHVQLHPGEVFSTGTDCVPDGAVKVLTEEHRVEISGPRIGTLRHGAGVVPEAGELNLDYSRLEYYGGLDGT
jgi:2-keto-4-pentenoate hydratase/2-oxohepta-3-ene-1,7-dioic acid hydratase in catechol pathway